MIITLIELILHQEIYTVQQEIANNLTVVTSRNIIWLPLIKSYKKAAQSCHWQWGIVEKKEFKLIDRGVRYSCSLCVTASTTVAQRAQTRVGQGPCLRVRYHGTRPPHCHGTSCLVTSCGLGSQAYARGLRLLGITPAQPPVLLAVQSPCTCCIYLDRLYAPKSLSI